MIIPDQHAHRIVGGVFYIKNLCGSGRGRFAQVIRNQNSNGVVSSLRVSYIKSDHIPFYETRNDIRHAKEKNIDPDDVSMFFRSGFHNTGSEIINVSFPFGVRAYTRGLRLNARLLVIGDKIRSADPYSMVTLPSMYIDDYIDVDEWAKLIIQSPHPWQKPIAASPYIAYLPIKVFLESSFRFSGSKAALDELATVSRARGILIDPAMNIVMVVTEMTERRDITEAARPYLSWRRYEDE